MTAAKNITVNDGDDPTPMQPVGEFKVKSRGSVDPRRFPDELFELFSIPAYDSQNPEVLHGKEIGSSKKVVEPGDVLISRIVPHIQRVWVVGPSNGHRQIASGEWLVFGHSDVDQEYLRYMLLSTPFHQQFLDTVAGMGGSLLRARPSEVERIEIPVPKLLPEQQRIAAILDKADAIRRKREQVLTLADDFLKSTFLEMFGDPSENPKKYPVENFASILSIPLRNGISPSSRGTVLARVLTLTAITGDHFDEEQEKEGKFLVPISAKDTVNDSDFYICRGNGSPDLIGKGFYATQTIPGTAFPDTMIAAKPNPKQVTRAFLEGIWNSPFVRNQILEAARTTNGTFKINQTAAGAIKLPMPPMEAQKRFQTIVDQVRQSNEKLKFGDDLFPSLSQRAFNGEL
ncbi:restriction endonuclease subunit S [Phaeobacter sp. NW0010-22]|uniref:restriction endonuclease subunit S n=1 Tax=Phaeobacter sp. NW0010-22 TaxID=3135907 RepID=UPI003103919F